MNTKINYNIKKILKEFQDKYLVDDIMNKSKIIHDLDEYNPKLIEALIRNETIKNNFTINISGHMVVQINKLIDLFETDEYWKDSYTKYFKKIGLTVDGKFIDESTDVVLDFPYKDTVLKANMSKEDTDKNELENNEPFLNEIIAKEEIDVLLDKKILINAKKYDENGESAIDNISLDDNLIIKGNNLLALHSLKDRYSGKVKLIYIDPPYNTKGDSFVYNDQFNHSTWLTFILNRIEVAKDLLSDEGVLFVQCDDNEQAYLKVLLDEVFGRNNFINNLSVVMNLKGNQDEFGFAGTHEYILVYAKSKENAKLYNLNVDDPDELESWKSDDIGMYKVGANLKATGVNAPRDKRPNLFYPIYLNNDKEISLEENVNYPIEVLPITNGLEMSWRWQKSTFLKNISDVIVSEHNGEFSFYKKQRPEIGDLPSRKPKTLFYKPQYSSGNGTNQIKKLFGEKIFNYPKPEDLIKDIIQIATLEGDLVLDFFMGSATTQAVSHKMKRRYIGVEQMDYINTVSVPRLMKVINGDQGGISKELDWLGGGSFVYVELMEKNKRLINLVIEAETSIELMNVFNKMIVESEIDFRVDLEKVSETVFDLPFDEQKSILIRIIDKNQMYYNLSEIDDANVRGLISDIDYSFNKKFYDKGSE